MWWNEKVRPRVKPVFVNFAPEPTDGATPNWPEDESRAWIAKWSKRFAALSNAEVLEPAVVNSWDEIAAFEKQLTRDIDFLLPSPAGRYYSRGWRLSLPAEAKLAEFGIPILKTAMTVWSFEDLEMIAGLRAQGYEAYWTANIDQLNEILRLKQLKKALNHSKVLIFERLNNSSAPLTSTIIGNIYDPRLIRKRLGIDVEYFPLEKLRLEIERADTKRAEALADEWVRTADEVRTVFRPDELDREHLVNFAKLYHGLKAVLQNTGATALAGCFGPGTVAARKAPPCMIFSILKDEGIPCGCEADMNATLAQIMLTYISNKPADMGNVLIPMEDENMEDFAVPKPKPTEIALTHAVTPRKMRGFDTTPQPYRIIGTHCATCYAACPYVELDKGQVVTITRMAPNADKLMLAKGVLKNTAVTVGQGNREVVYIDVGRSGQEFLRDLQDFGNHLTFVYGDHLGEASALCRELGLEPVIL